ncbi:hypothetical protein BDV26DRAFT_251237 [Aspergillus bertholletiae]|uniref:Uncharacterized protein n=1 Tax=Aspergillus bertholletiae TaxID=1226010 RepID=A0A5N7BP14_9EURO|nr:hypothetical protein BDV26DRAFT_251237 [Aspergillus bertholletiae]
MHPMERLGLSPFRTRYPSLPPTPLHASLKTKQRASLTEKLIDCGALTHPPQNYEVKAYCSI